MESRVAPAAIIFDMDGVIADTRAAHQAAWRDFAARHGASLEMVRFVARTFGRGNREIFGEFFPEMLVDHEEFERRADEKESLFRERFARGEAPALPGLHEFVEARAAEGLALAVGSSAPHGNITAVLAGLGVAPHFSVIVSADDVPNSKPDPAIFLRCCELLELPPARCLVLEDSLHGLEAARRAGCPAIGVTTMHTPAELAPHCLATAVDFHGVEAAWQPTISRPPF